MSSNWKNYILKFSSSSFLTFSTKWRKNVVSYRRVRFDCFSIEVIVFGALTYSQLFIFPYLEPDVRKYDIELNNWWVSYRTLLIFRFTSGMWKEEEWCQYQWLWLHIHSITSLQKQDCSCDTVAFGYSLICYWCGIPGSKYLIVKQSGRK